MRGGGILERLACGSWVAVHVALAPRHQQMTCLGRCFDISEVSDIKMLRTY